MSNPTWVTASGSIKNPVTGDIYFQENTMANVRLVANISGSNSDILTYTLLNGRLPSGTLLNGNGLISGTFANVNADTTSEFTVRVTETTSSNLFVGLSDRTFSMTVQGPDAPYWSWNSPSSKVIVANTTVSGNITSGILTVANVSPIQVGQVISDRTSNSSIANGTTVSSVDTANNKITISQAPLANVSNIVCDFSYIQLPSTTDSIWYASNGNAISVQAASTDPLQEIIYTVESGSLPQGLELATNGQIKGYANAVTSSTVSEFVVKATSTNTLYSYGRFKLQVNPATSNRPPAILNNEPLTLIVPTSDPYYSYYLEGTYLGKFEHKNQFIFKFIGYNFQDVPVTESPYTYGMRYTVEYLNSSGVYSSDFNSADAGNPFDASPNIVNTSQGWINGTLRDLRTDINTYTLKVRVALVTDNTKYTERIFTFVVIGLIDDTIIWNTPSYLGKMKSGDICDFSVNATFGRGVTDGRYIYVPPVDGELYKSIPPNLQILNDGNLSGRVIFTDPPGTYTFQVKAYSPEFSEIYSIKTFTLEIEETYQNPPYDTVYLHALMPASDRLKIEGLLDNITATQASKIYRITDDYYGIATSINVMQMFGIYTVPTEDFYQVYIPAVNENFYWRNITLGQLKTAVAKDELGNIIYEVVYSEIYDDLVNNDGISISKEIVWPQTIKRQNGPGPSYDSRLYPASLPNMNIQLEDTVGMYNDSNLLPRWMRSQQANGSVLGYTPCWVICYTEPGKSGEVLASINEYLTENHLVLNQISFELDRFEVDRSITYEYTGNGQWANDQTVQDDSKDNIVYYPRKTILKRT